MGMRPALLAAAALAAFAASALACSAMESDSTASMSPDGAERGDAAGSLGEPAGPDATQSPLLSARGVVLVHAAEFPALRVCLEAAMDAEPLPDDKNMPLANVVGVDRGSAVHIGTLPEGADLTKRSIYVIDESVIRRKYAAGSTERPTCRELICEGGPDCLRPNLDYVRATAETLDSTSAGVSVLAITGCGPKAFVGPTPAHCLANGTYNDATGNLAAVNLPLEARQRLADTLPTQVLQLSEALALGAQGRNFDVAFLSDLDGGAEPVSLSSDAQVGATSDVRELAFDARSEGVFDRAGFRVSIGAADGGATTVDFTLANVQGFSAPTLVPSEFYATASSYALLVLGDPSHRDEAVDGGAAPTFDRYRGLHLLAVPVVDPDDARDAGPDSGGSDAPPAAPPL